MLVLIGTLIRWSLSGRKRAKAMVNLLKLTNLLDEAKCYEVMALVGFRGDGERAQATSASIKEPSKAFPRLRAL